MPVVNPRVPEGLRDLMKDLTKEVLREKPPNIYEFSEHYFESMLQGKQDFTVKGYEPVASYEHIIQTRERNQIPVALVFKIIPEGLTALIKDFIKAVLRERPENICEFAVEYFRRVRREGSSETAAVQYDSYDNYFQSKERFSFTPYVKCTCGRTFGEGIVRESEVSVGRTTNGVSTEHLRSSTNGVLSDTSLEQEHLTQKEQTVPKENSIEKETVEENNNEPLPLQAASDGKADAKGYDEAYINAIHVIEKETVEENNNEPLPLQAATNGKADAKGYDEAYIKAIHVIQRFFKRHLRKKRVAPVDQVEDQASSVGAKRAMTEEAAAIIIQRSLRKLFTDKFQRNEKMVPNLENLQHLDEHNDNVSEAASYTSASTVQMSAGETTARDNIENEVILSEEQDVSHTIVGCDDVQNEDASELHKRPKSVSNSENTSTKLVNEPHEVLIAPLITGQDGSESSKSIISEKEGEDQAYGEMSQSLDTTDQKNATEDSGSDIPIIHNEEKFVDKDRETTSSEKEDYKDITQKLESEDGKTSSEPIIEKLHTEELEILQPEKTSTDQKIRNLNSEDGESLDDSNQRKDQDIPSTKEIEKEEETTQLNLEDTLRADDIVLANLLETKPEESKSEDQSKDISDQTSKVIASKMNESENNSKDSLDNKTEVVLPNDNGSEQEKLNDHEIKSNDIIKIISGDTVQSEEVSHELDEPHILHNNEESNGTNLLEMDAQKSKIITDALPDNKEINEINKDGEVEEIENTKTETSDSKEPLETKREKRSIMDNPETEEKITDVSATINEAVDANVEPENSQILVEANNGNEIDVVGTKNEKQLSEVHDSNKEEHEDGSKLEDKAERIENDDSNSTQTENLLSQELDTTEDVDPKNSIESEKEDVAIQIRETESFPLESSHTKKDLIQHDDKETEKEHIEEGSTDTPDAATTSASIDSVIPLTVTDSDLDNIETLKEPIEEATDEKKNNENVEVIDENSELKKSSMETLELSNKTEDNFANTNYSGDIKIDVKEPNQTEIPTLKISESTDFDENANSENMEIIEENIMAKNLIPDIAKEIETEEETVNQSETENSTFESSKSNANEDVKSDDMASTVITETEENDSSSNENKTIENPTENYSQKVTDSSVEATESTQSERIENVKPDYLMTITKTSSTDDMLRHEDASNFEQESKMEKLDMKPENDTAEEDTSYTNIVPGKSADDPHKLHEIEIDSKNIIEKVEADKPIIKDEFRNSEILPENDDKKSLDDSKEIDSEIKELESQDNDLSKGIVAGSEEVQNNTIVDSEIKTEPLELVPSPNQSVLESAIGNADEQIEPVIEKKDEDEEACSDEVNKNTANKEDLIDKPVTKNQEDDIQSKEGAAVINSTEAVDIDPNDNVNGSTETTKPENEVLTKETQEENTADATIKSMDEQLEYQSLTGPDDSKLINESKDVETDVSKNTPEDKNIQEEPELTNETESENVETIEGNLLTDPASSEDLETVQTVNMSDITSTVDNIAEPDVTTSNQNIDKLPESEDGKETPDTVHTTGNEPDEITSSKGEVVESESIMDIWTEDTSNETDKDPTYTTDCHHNTVKLSEDKNIEPEPEKIVTKSEDDVPKLMDIKNESDIVQQSGDHETGQELKIESEESPISPLDKENVDHIEGEENKARIKREMTINEGRDLTENEKVDESITKAQSEETHKEGRESDNKKKIDNLEEEDNVKAEAEDDIQLKQAHSEETHKEERENDNEKEMDNLEEKDIVKTGADDDILLKQAQSEENHKEGRESDKEKEIENLVEQANVKTGAEDDILRKQAQSEENHKEERENDIENDNLAKEDHVKAGIEGDIQLQQAQSEENHEERESDNEKEKDNLEQEANVKAEAADEVQLKPIVESKGLKGENEEEVIVNTEDANDTKVEGNVSESDHKTQELNSSNINETQAENIDILTIKEPNDLDLARVEMLDDDVNTRAMTVTNEVNKTDDKQEKTVPEINISQDDIGETNILDQKEIDNGKEITDESQVEELQSQITETTPETVPHENDHKTSLDGSKDDVLNEITSKMEGTETADNDTSTATPNSLAIGTQNSFKSRTEIDNSENSNNVEHIDSKNIDDPYNWRKHTDYPGRPSDPLFAEIHLKSFNRPVKPPPPFIPEWMPRDDEPIEHSSSPSKGESETEIVKESVPVDERRIIEESDHETNRDNVISITDLNSLKSDGTVLTEDDEAIIKLYGENERTPTYLYGIHTPQNTPTLPRKNDIKSNTAFTVPLNELAGTKIKNKSDENAASMNGEAQEANGEYDSLQKNNKHVKLENSDSAQKIPDLINKPLPLDLQNNDENFETEIDLETPTKLFAELNQFDDLLDATLTAQDAEYFKINAKLPTSEEVQSNYDLDPSVETSADVVLPNDDYKMLSTPDTTLNTILELNESDEPCKNELTLIAGKVQPTDEDVASQSEKQYIIDAMNEPYDPLEFGSGSDNESELTSSWTCSKETDENFFSDEFVNEITNENDHHRVRKAINQTGEENNMQGGIYEVDLSDQNTLTKQENDEESLETHSDKHKSLIEMNEADQNTKVEHDQVVIDELGKESIVTENIEITNSEELQHIVIIKSEEKNLNERLETPVSSVSEQQINSQQIKLHNIDSESHLEDSEGLDSLNAALHEVNKHLDKTETMLEQSVANNYTTEEDLTFIEDSILVLKDSTIKLSEINDLILQAPEPPTHDPSEMEVPESSSESKSNWTEIDLANAATTIQKHFRGYYVRKRRGKEHQEHSINAAHTKDSLSDQTGDKKNKIISSESLNATKPADFYKESQCLETDGNKLSEIPQPIATNETKANEDNKTIASEEAQHNSLMENVAGKATGTEKHGIGEVNDSHEKIEQEKQKAAVVIQRGYRHYANRKLRNTPKTNRVKHIDVGTPEKAKEVSKNAKELSIKNNNAEKIIQPHKNENEVDPEVIEKENSSSNESRVPLSKNIATDFNEIKSYENSDASYVDKDSSSDKIEESADSRLSKSNEGEETHSASISESHTIDVTNDPKISNKSPYEKNSELISENNVSIHNKDFKEQSDNIIDSIKQSNDNKKKIDNDESIMKSEENLKISTESESKNAEKPEESKVEQSSTHISDEPTEITANSLPTVTEDDLEELDEKVQEVYEASSETSYADSIININQGKIASDDESQKKDTMNSPMNLNTPTIIKKKEEAEIISPEETKNTIENSFTTITKTDESSSREDLKIGSASQVNINNNDVESANENGFVSSEHSNSNLTDIEDHETLESKKEFEGQKSMEQSTDGKEDSLMNVNQPNESEFSSENSLHYKTILGPNNSKKTIETPFPSGNNYQSLQSTTESDYFKSEETINITDFNENDTQYECKSQEDIETNSESLYENEEFDSMTIIDTGDSALNNIDKKQQIQSLAEDKVIEDEMELDNSISTAQSNGNNVNEPFVENETREIFESESKSNDNKSVASETVLSSTNTDEEVKENQITSEYPNSIVQSTNGEVDSVKEDIQSNVDRFDSQNSLIRAIKNYKIISDHGKTQEDLEPPSQPTTDESEENKTQEDLEPSSQPTNDESKENKNTADNSFIEINENNKQDEGAKDGIETNTEQEKIDFISIIDSGDTALNNMNRPQQIESPTENKVIDYQIESGHGNDENKSDAPKTELNIVNADEDVNENQIIFGEYPKNIHANGEVNLLKEGDQTNESQFVSENSLITAIKHYKTILNNTKSQDDIVNLSQSADEELLVEPEIETKITTRNSSTKNDGDKQENIKSEKGIETNSESLYEHEVFDSISTIDNGDTALNVINKEQQMMFLTEEKKLNNSMGSEQLNENNVNETLVENATPKVLESESKLNDKKSVTSETDLSILSTDEKSNETEMVTSEEKTDTKDNSVLKEVKEHQEGLNITSDSKVELENTSRSVEETTESHQDETNESSIDEPLVTVIETKRNNLDTISQDSLEIYSDSFNDSDSFDSKTEIGSSEIRKKRSTEYIEPSVSPKNDDLETQNEDRPKLDWYVGEEPILRSEINHALDGEIVPKVIDESIAYLELDTSPQVEVVNNHSNLSNEPTSSVEPATSPSINSVPDVKVDSTSSLFLLDPQSIPHISNLNQSDETVSAKEGGADEQKVVQEASILNQTMELSASCSNVITEGKSDKVDEITINEKGGEGDNTGHQTDLDNGSGKNRDVEEETINTTTGIHDGHVGTVDVQKKGSEDTQLDESENNEKMDCDKETNQELAAESPESLAALKVMRFTSDFLNTERNKNVFTDSISKKETLTSNDTEVELETRDQTEQNNEVLESVVKDTTKDLQTLSEFLNLERRYWESDIPYTKMEQPCIKKSVSLTHLDDESSAVEAMNDEQLEIQPDQVDPESEQDASDSLGAMTEKLREADVIIEKMQQRRASETRSSMLDVKEPSFEEPIIKTMQELQDNRSIDGGDDEIVVLNRLQREDTRQSSAESDSVVFGPDHDDDKDFNDLPIVKASLHRLNTIAGDDPKGLFKSVTIDDTIKYIEPPESETTATSGSSFCMDDDMSENIRQKMMAYSLSEADSDYFEAEAPSNAEKSRLRRDDFNISTALVDMAGTSSETESSIASAATKIQAGARGFLTRRRLRRASVGTKTSQQDNDKASFGNDAIGESLEKLIEEEAAKKIQKAFRNYYRQKGVNSLPSSGDHEDISNPQVAKAKTGPELDPVVVSSFESTLAARRMTLQRGDAMRNDSTPDDDNGNGRQLEKIADVSRPASVTDGPTRTAAAATVGASAKKIDNELKWIALRQNSMPVQIDSEIFRVIPKHMRKRIKSAGGEKKIRVRVLKD